MGLPAFKGDTCYNNYWYGRLSKVYSKPTNGKVSPKLTPEERQRIYGELNDFMAFLGSYSLGAIKYKNYTLRAFEAICKERGFNFHRRSLHGLVKKERSDFRLSYFMKIFEILELDFNVAFLCYADHLRSEKEEK